MGTWLGSLYLFCFCILSHVLFVCSYFIMDRWGVEGFAVKWKEWSSIPAQVGVVGFALQGNERASIAPQVGCGRFCCEVERMGLHCDGGSYLLLTVKVPGCKPHPFSILPWTLGSLPCPHWASPGRSPFTSPPAGFPDIHSLWELPGHLAQSFPGSDLTGQQGL